MGFKRRSFDSPRVDLTPMIDVVFLLLIFFMISTTFIEKPGMTIDLPEASMQQLNNEDKEVQVYLTADGQIFLKQEPVTLAQLTEHLASYGVAGKQMTFMLMADKDALHGQVIALMDLAKVAGFGKLAIATDKEDEQSDE
jgi:biopolymer transport protein ExbD/biopolymer transport protein TolR